MIENKTPHTKTQISNDAIDLTDNGLAALVDQHRVRETTAYKAGYLVAKLMKKLDTEDSVPFVLSAPPAEYDYSFGRMVLDEDNIGDAVFEMRMNGYACSAPYFTEILLDNDRTQPIKTLRKDIAAKGSSPLPWDRVHTVTEQFAANDLYDFLWDFLAENSQEPFSRPLLAKTAAGMLNNLTFIGEKEYQEAALALGAMWKQYLDADPSNQLCVWTKISNSQPFKKMQKSDVHLLDRVLTTFSDEDIKKYGGRIVTEPEFILSEPDNVRIVLLDDWIISGSSMADSVDMLLDELPDRYYEDCLEINTLVTNEMLAHIGFDTRRAYDPEENIRMIPVFGYFIAHDSPGTSLYMHEAHVSGSHSSVDFDYEIDIANMLELINERRFEKRKPPIEMPFLTNIVRSYRKSKLKHKIGKNKIKRLQ